MWKERRESAGLKHQRAYLTPLLCLYSGVVAGKRSRLSKECSSPLSLLPCSPSLVSNFSFLSLFSLSFLFGRLAVSRLSLHLRRHISGNQYYNPFPPLLFYRFLPGYYNCNTLVGVVIDNPPSLSFTHSASSFGSQ